MYAHTVWYIYYIHSTPHAHIYNVYTCICVTCIYLIYRHSFSSMHATEGIRTFHAWIISGFSMHDSLTDRIWVRCIFPTPRPARTMTVFTEPKPRCLHTTLASSTSNPDSQIVPHSPFTLISTRPLHGTAPALSLMVWNTTQYIIILYMH